MNIKEEQYELVDPQVYRELYIREMNNSENQTKFAEENAESLYALGLTMYSNVFSLNSAIYNGFAVSCLDKEISLHPEQLKIIQLICENKGLIFSAPTSFGKTFVIFEYIARYKPQNIVLVVPTLALIDEYKRKIINQYKNVYGEYNVYLSIEKDKEYDSAQKNIFLVTHDRVVDVEIHEIIKSIDFLVIDEIYKLQRDEEDDRVLILNLAYYNLVEISKKYVLLAPFIKGIENLDKLDDVPVFYGTNFSPVVNEVKTYPVLREEDRIFKTNELLNKLSGNTLIYFPTVRELDGYIQQIQKPYNNEQPSNPLLDEFVSWAKMEIHEEWSILHAMECGYLVHHGQLPLGIRMLELDLFNDKNEKFYQRMLCTSTLLEGVNTSAENIIITKPARRFGENFDAFDFYNLVGRTGRLFQHCLGTAYYIKGPDDKEYLKEEALKSIEFELTTDSIDIDINNGNYQEHVEFIDFLEKLHIDYDTYKHEIASKCRFGTVLFLYGNYISKKQELFAEIYRQLTNDSVGRLELIRRLYDIVSKDKYNKKIQTYIINRLLYLIHPRPNIKSVVDATLNSYKGADVNDVIKRTIQLKNSYIEYEFYKRIQIIVFFMECEHQDRSMIDIIKNKILKAIEILYYINSPARKMLKDMGIYDGDIDYIVEIIGEDFNTVDDLRDRIRRSLHNLRRISCLSRYVIERFIA